MTIAVDQHEKPLHHSERHSISATEAAPIIGVTGPDCGGGAAWIFTWLAVTLAGGHAVRITPSHPRAIEHLDGLIIGGGADVDPALYGRMEPRIIPRSREREKPLGVHVLDLVLFPLTWIARKFSGWFVQSRRDEARDQLELRLIEQAIAAGKPILGICRGQQLLNTCFGGTLHQSLSGLYIEDPEARTILPRKRIITDPQSQLARIWRRQRPPVRVNALHRQGIDQLGRGIRAAARDRNGIIQAIEHQSLLFVIGVQWHPEYLPQRAEQRSLFHALVRAARDHQPITSDNPFASS